MVSFFFVCEMIKMNDGYKEEFKIKILLPNKKYTKKLQNLRTFQREKTKKKTNYGKLIKKSNEIVLKKKFKIKSKIKWQHFEKNRNKKVFSRDSGFQDSKFPIIHSYFGAKKKLLVLVKFKSLLLFAQKLNTNISNSFK